MSEVSKESNPIKEELSKSPVFTLPLTKEQSKIESRFNNGLTSVLAILKGEDFKPKQQVPKDDISELMDEMFKEELESIKEEAKTKFKALLKSKVEFDKTINEETRKFQSIIMSKKKELADKMDEVLKLLNGVDTMKKEFLSSLGTESGEEEENKE